MTSITHLAYIPRLILNAFIGCQEARFITRQINALMFPEKAEYNMELLKRQRHKEKNGHVAAVEEVK